MSLVTRCPTCATTFKVVRDQLRISDGWVRCGRCNEVFDATQDLLDAETGVPVPPQSFVLTPPAVVADDGVEQERLAPAPQAVDAVAAPADAPTPFDALHADLGDFGSAAAAIDAADAADALHAPHAPAAPRANAWPAPDLLELQPSVAAASAPVSVPMPASVAPSPPAAAPASSRLPLPGVPSRDTAPPAPTVPAWRRIQVSSVPGAPGLMADEPWPMRQASASPSGPTADSAKVLGPKASPLEAAVDAHLQKALRRARADALREERASARATGASAAPVPAPSQEAGVEPAATASTASMSALRQASTEGAGERAELPSADVMLVVPRPPADFMASEPAALELRASARGRTWVLGALALVAAVLLVAQLLRHERNAWAASQPILRPAIEALCELSKCAVGAPRRIDAVRIDGSSFTPSREGERYELVFTLRNAAPTVVAMPSIELSLLDANERPVVRRIFHPADFGAPGQMAPRGEQMAQLRLALALPPDTRAPAVVGYSMLAFYP